LLWLSKIFFGILYKESLLYDQHSRDSERILTSDDLRQHDSLRFFLQQTRGTVRLVDFNAGSVYIFPAQALQEPRNEWDLCDNLFGQFIACRVGKVALFASLGDGGAHQYLEDRYKDISDLPLHPLQFRELCADFSYGATLRTRVPKYLTISGAPHLVHQMPLAGLSNKPLFEDGNARDYARHLSRYTEIPTEQLFVPPDKHVTWLRKPSGEPNFMSVRDFPENCGGRV
jgi:hypothetical protein